MGRLVRVESRLWSWRIAAVTIAFVAVVLVTGNASGAGGPKCSSFSSQEKAQDSFFSHGGSSSNRIGALDSDHDGVACEKLPGPNKGSVAMSYEARRKFFYGDVSIPEGQHHDFPCLYKNPIEKIYRRVALYKVGRKAPFTDLKGTAKAGAGTLIWKLEAKGSVKGKFYVSVPQSETERAGPSEECPEFRSRSIEVP